MLSHRRTFLKQLGFGTAGLGWVLSFSMRPPAQASPRRQLPRDTPERQGVSSRAILDFLRAIESSKHEFHSFMLARHGQIIAEAWWPPYRPSGNQMLYSLSKSFAATAIGLAAAEGRLRVDDHVCSFFPEALPEKVSAHLSALRIRDLLTMSVGHAEDSTGAMRKSHDWVKTFLGLPVKNPPGTAFLYNSGATYMLSAIIQKVTGQRLLAYLRPRLFDPLGIEGMTWESCPLGIDVGGWGLSLQTESLAKFGQLYLQRGVWQGRRILPASWVEEATSFKIQQPAADLESAKQKSDWHQGYCYQFWRCRNNAFRGDGAFGQYTIVLPDQDAVIAITSESPNMQGQMDLIWEHLFPALGRSPLTPDGSASRELEEKISSLTLLPPANRSASTPGAAVSGRRFVLERNDLGAESFSFAFRRDAAVFTLRTTGGFEHVIRCGMGKWLEGETRMPGTPTTLTGAIPGQNSKVTAAGVWRDADTFEMTWRYFETPHHDKVTCRFDGSRARLEFLNSITAMSPSFKEKRPALAGGG
jgi:CubicO group peptidase (beta-lactamase class C family)